MLFDKSMDLKLFNIPCSSIRGPESIFIWKTECRASEASLAPAGFIGQCTVGSIKPYKLRKVTVLGGGDKRRQVHIEVVQGDADDGELWLVEGGRRARGRGR
ncbi:hypothetical protein TIFTF001_055187 [Ficus carica]|uniref:Uncharacterized protein n=1 Tax=Ficus carica TaxID=3494 RepID=A0AA88EBU3_FICCA|nr:hypothetical protein TIFTF001_055187 [Ficus carica]